MNVKNLKKKLIYFEEKKILPVLNFRKTRFDQSSLVHTNPKKKKSGIIPKKCKK